MSKKEFYEKHTKTENGMYPGQQDVACSVTTPPIQLWQWIEQQIKQARVDERQKIIDFIDDKGAYKKEIILDYLVKELTGELK